MSNETTNLSALNRSERVLHEIEETAYKNNLEGVIAVLKVRYRDNWLTMTEAEQLQLIRNQMDEKPGYLKDFITGLVEEFNKVLKENERLNHENSEHKKANKGTSEKSEKTGG